MSVISSDSDMVAKTGSEPVFIVGGSRTGSEMLKTMLLASGELDFVDEPFLICPWWLHKDLESNIRESVGDLTEPFALDRLIDLLYSGIPYGWFWTVIEERVDKTRLRAELENESLDMGSIIAAIMKVHSEAQGKSGMGAKFPVHYSQTDKLLEWFPNCRIIHTTRNPKAVYASQSVKYLVDGQSSVSKGYEKFKQFVHINIQTTWTSVLHKRYSSMPNYTLVRYEDVVNSPETVLRRLCEFLGIQYLPKMLLPNQYGSSFSRIGAARGVDSSSLDRWQTTISPITAAAIGKLHRRAFRELGYGT